MKSKKLILLIYFAALFFPEITSAQFTNIRQWQADYAFTNPAFTGISVNPRVTFSFSNYFPIVVDNQNNYELHYDQQLSPKAGFIGASVNYDVTSSIAERYVGGLQYAYEFDLKNKLKLRAGTSVSFVHLDVDTTKVIGTAGDKALVDQSAAHIGFGGLLAYKNTFIGLSASNFTHELTSNNAAGKKLLYSSFSLQAGAFFPLNKASEKSVVLAPHLIVFDITKGWGIVPGINVNKGIFTGGISYRAYKIPNDIIALTAGISKGWIKTGLTYDFGLRDARTVSRNIWTGSSQFTLTIYPGKIREGAETGLPHYFRKMGF